MVFSCMQDEDDDEEPFDLKRKRYQASTGRVGNWYQVRRWAQLNPEVSDSVEGVRRQKAEAKARDIDKSSEKKKGSRE